MLPLSNLSFWEKETFLNNIDYLIVGSGIVGLSTAIHLKQLDPTKKVVILERGYLPSGASTKNAGFACFGSASELLNDLKTDTEDSVFKIVTQRWEGLQALRTLVGDKELDYLELGSHELYSTSEKALYYECLKKLPYLNQKLHKLTGIEQIFEAAPNYCEEQGFQGFKYAISNKAEGQVDTGKMIQALLQKAHGLGILLFNNIEVTAIHSESISTNRGEIQFKKLAICNNGLAHKILPNEDVTPARAQVIVTSEIPNLKLKGTYHFDKGYYYFRNIGNRILFGGGRNINFEAEETDELNTSDQIISHLTSILEVKVLPNSSFTIDHQWAGTMGVGKTKAPIVRKVTNSIYCGIRLGGMGIAIGTSVGKQLAINILKS